MKPRFDFGFKPFHWVILFILIHSTNCKPSRLENASDAYSSEYMETQTLLCLLKTGFCKETFQIVPLVQFNFTNGSIQNSGSLAMNLTSPEWGPLNTFGKDGDVNGAFNNDTNNRYFTTNTDSGLPLGASPRTMCAWINPSTLPAVNDHHIVMRYGNLTTANGSALAISNFSGYKISFLGNSYDALALETIAINTWTHLCATFNGGTTITFYVNGNLIAIQALTGTGPLNTTSGSFAIGTLAGSGYPNYWRGAFDDIMIYGLELNAIQIRQIYTTGNAY